MRTVELVLRLQKVLHAVRATVHGAELEAAETADRASLHVRSDRSGPARLEPDQGRHQQEERREERQTRQARQRRRIPLPREARDGTSRTARPHSPCRARTATFEPGVIEMSGTLVIPVVEIVEPHPIAQRAVPRDPRVWTDEASRHDRPGDTEHPRQSARADDGRVLGNADAGDDDGPRNRAVGAIDGPRPSAPAAIVRRPAPGSRLAHSCSIAASNP